MNSVEGLAQQLSNLESHPDTIAHLLRHLSSAHDVTAASDRLVRYVLDHSAASPNAINHALDILFAAPSHNHWPQTLAFLIKALQSQSLHMRVLALQKLPALPHSAWQHMLLFATSVLRRCFEDGSVQVRVAMVAAAAAAVLRERPLTAAGVEALRLQELEERQLALVRSGVEVLMFGLLNAVLDGNDNVAGAALDRLTAFALQSTRDTEVSVLKKPAYVAGCVIWKVLFGNCERIAQRFEGGVRAGRVVVKGLARLAAAGLSRRFGGGDKAYAWAVGWVDKELCGMCDRSTGVTACEGLLLICCYAEGLGDEKVAGWGIKAIRKMVKILESGGLSPVMLSEVVAQVVGGLAALSKNDLVKAKFVVSVVVTLLGVVGEVARMEERFEALSVMASTIVEYDLSGRDSGVGTSLRAVLSSEAWKEILKKGDQAEGGEYAAEIVCCLGQSMLEASRKIAQCNDQGLKINLTQTWASMLAYLLIRTRPCLKWPYSPSSRYAIELYLKVFDALGQYSAFAAKSQGVGVEEYERLQEAMVKEAMEQDDIGTRAALLSCVTKYWLTSGMRAEANVGHMLRALWRHAQEHYCDEEIMLNELKTGALWSDARKGSKASQQRTIEGGYVSMATSLTKRTRAVIDTVGATVGSAIETRLFGSVALATAAAEGSTLTTDFAYSFLSAILALIAHNPSVAEKGVKILQKYIAILEDAESPDFIVLEAVRNTIAGMEMYLDEFHPNRVQTKEIPALARVIEERSDRGDALSWLRNITESCVFATSRLEDPSKESSTVETEETILHKAWVTKRRMRGFSFETLQSFEAQTQPAQGEQQTLNGASDPFGVTASHFMDTVKGLAFITVTVLNRSKFRASNVALVWSSSGALIPQPDAKTSYSLGNIEQGAYVTEKVTLAVRSGQGYAARVFFSVHTWREAAQSGPPAEQSCVPYYVPSSDVLLLRPPPANAGVDVFRRRWDLMRHATSFQVHLGREQSVDSFVDVLERRSKCLRVVGRMRTYSHVCALVADSSRGDYVALAVLAPEAHGNSGVGPCVLYVTIRSNSDGYNKAFRVECREWLSRRHKVIFPDEPLDEESKRLALKPQDAYFITESREGLSPYQRWRVAHSVRSKY